MRLGATRERQQGRHPLQSDRGTTTIQPAVVSSIVGTAAGEVDGIHLSHGGRRLPGDTSPTIGELLDNVTGTTSRIRGVSVEVGEQQVAVDIVVNVVYGKPIHRVAEALRRNVIRRVKNLTGLDVVEVNITVNDLTFSDQ